MDILGEEHSWQKSILSRKSSQCKGPETGESMLSWNCSKGSLCLE